MIMGTQDTLESSLLYLPEEIVLHIATFLTMSDLFQGLSCTCWYLNNLIRNASRYGTVANFLTLSNHSYTSLNKDQQNELTQFIVESCALFKGLEMEGFDNGFLVNNIVEYACEQNSITSLQFRGYVT